MRWCTWDDGLDPVSSSEAKGCVCALRGARFCAGIARGREASIGTGGIVQQGEMTSGIDFSGKRFQVSWGDRGRCSVWRVRPGTAASAGRDAGPYSTAYQRGESK